MNFQTEGRFAFFFFFFNHLFGCFLREAKSPFMLSQGQIQQLTGATDLQGLTDPSFSRAPSHQGVLHSMLASGFRHQLANLSSYRKISSPSFPSLLQFHYNFLPSYSLFSVPLPQLKPPQQSATSTDDLPFPADPGMMEMLIPHPYPPRGDLSCTASSAHLPTPSSLSPSQPSLLAFPLQTPPGTIFLLSPSNICRPLSPLVTPRLSFVQTKQQEEGQGRGAGGRRHGEMGARGAVRP